MHLGRKKRTFTLYLSTLPPSIYTILNLLIVLLFLLYLILGFSVKCLIVSMSNHNQMIVHSHFSIKYVVKAFSLP